MFKLLTVVAVIGLWSCTRAEPMPTTTEPTTPSSAEPSAQVVTTRAEAEAALGKVVRATGTVRREKPGDSISGPALDVLCPDYRFDDDVVGSEITIVGTLRQISLPEATVSDTGAISQGVMPGTPPRFAMNDCKIVVDP